MFTCNDTELRALLDPAEVIAAIHAAFARDFAKVSMPQRTQVEMGAGTLLVMPCAIAGENLCGVKIVSVSREARAEGRVRASYILLDDCGKTVAVFEANYLTDLRTAATSAIATEILALPEAVTLGIFGTGRQAEAHVTMLSRLRNFRRILVSGTSAAKAEGFARRMQQSYGCEIQAADAESCTANSDVICTCTSSVEPLFRGELVRPGTHLNLIGTFQAHAREVDSVLIRSARVFVETYEAAFAEAGDILTPLRAGEITRAQVLGDLHELVSGEKPGRTRREDITVFKSVGCALEDLATAKLAWAAIQRRAETRTESTAS